MSALDILLVILRIAFGAFVPLSFVAVLVWMERRGAAFFQDRAGPNRCNFLGFRAGGLIQNAADFIAVIDDQGVFTYQSSSAKRVLGYDGPQLDGRGLVTLVDPEQRPGYDNFLATVRASPADNKIGEFRLTKADGQPGVG